MALSRTLKNIGRLNQILQVFRKHGFYKIILQMGLARYLGKEDKNEEPTPEEIEASKSQAERMRLAFEELGGTFIKLGQILSTRPDLIPEEYLNEFKRLQDDANPIPFESVKKVLADELKINLEEAFAEIDEKPLGSASIAQVHKARLHDGTVVVVKVQREGIAELIETDLSILFSLADLMEKYVKNLSFFRPKDVVSEFSRAIREELDFMHEAQNCDKMRECFDDDPSGFVPMIYWDYTTKKVMVMDYVEGIKISDLDVLREKGYDFKKLAQMGMDSFFRMIFDHGLFHGDLHGGNIIVMSESKIALIDFGLVGELSEQLVEELANLFIALMSQDFDALARTYLKISPSSKSVNEKAFAQDLEKLVKPWLNKPLNQINTGQIFLEMAQVAMRHKLTLPRDLIVLAKTLVALEGIGRSLDPDFDVTTQAKEHAGRLIAERYKPERMLEELVKTLRNLTEMGKDMPRQLQRLMDKIEHGNIAIELHIPKEEENRFQAVAGTRIGFALIIAGASVAGALLIGSAPESPGWMGIICFIFALLFGLMFLMTFKQNK